MSTIDGRPAPAETPRRPRRLMLLAILILTIAQGLPFDKDHSFLRERTNADPHPVVGHDYSRYSEHPAMYVDADNDLYGFQRHPAGLFILAGLAVVFLSKLYRRPGWKRSVYWVSLVVTAIGCTELPPPVTTLGGLVGLAGLALVAYAAWLNQKAPA